MRIENAAAHVSSLIPMDRASDAVEADWMRAYVLARVAVLAGSFMVLPLALVASPHALANVLGLFVALLGSAAAGLLALRHLGAFAAALAGLMALLALAIGPWPEFGGEAAAVAVIFAGLLEAAAMPRRHPARPWLLAGAVGIAVCIGALAWRAQYHDGEALWYAGLPLLLLPSLATLALGLSLARSRLEGATVMAGAADRREEMLIGGAGVAVLMVDRSGLVADCTRSAGELLLCEPGDLMGRGLFERLPIAGRPAFLIALSDALAGKRAADFRTKLLEGAPHAAMSRRFVDFTFSMRAAPSAPGAVAVRIERTSSLSVADAAAPADAALLKIISHEIRSPMHAILGFSSVLASSGAKIVEPEKVGDYARIIHRAAREAYAVSNALVALMHASSPDFRLEPQSIDLREVVVAAVGAARERIPDRPGAIDLVETNSEAPVETDLHAVTTLVGALIEGFSAAFDGRAHVKCSIVRAGLDPCLVVMARAEGIVVPINVAGQAGHLGVIEELSLRLAGALGVRAHLELAGPEISARLEFPRVWSRPKRAGASSEPSSVLPLRMSA